MGTAGLLQPSGPAQESNENAGQGQAGGEAAPPQASAQAASPSHGPAAAQVLLTAANARYFGAFWTQ